MALSALDRDWLRRIAANGTFKLPRHDHIAEVAADRLVSAGVLRWADRKGECFDRVALTPAGKREAGL